MFKRKAAKLNIEYPGHEDKTGFNCDTCPLRAVCTARDQFVYYISIDRREACVDFCRVWLGK